MRKAVLTAVLASSVVVWGQLDNAEAFCHKVRTTCIGYYPGLYSFAPCGGGYPPYVYSCTYRFPRYFGHKKSCWRGYLSCASRYPYNCGYGACGAAGAYAGGCGGSCRVGGGCYGGCDGFDGGCGRCGVGCDGCGGGCAGGCDGSVGGCDGCAGGVSSDSHGAPKSTETEGETIYDGPAPEPAEPAEVAPPADGDPMASHRPVGFRLTTATRRDGTPAYSQGLRSFWDGNMTEALRSFDAAAAAEPQNALYQYYRALSFYNLEGPDAASHWLQRAVEMERQAPIKNWGKNMERVQGRARLWVEQARSAGVAR